METQITQRVEAALTSVQGVKHVTTTITPGVSTTPVELQLNADIGRARWMTRATRCPASASELPADITEPVIQSA